MLFEVKLELAFKVNGSLSECLLILFAGGEIIGDDDWYCSSDSKESTKGYLSTAQEKLIKFSKGSMERESHESEILRKWSNEEESEKHF